MTFFSAREKYDEAVRETKLRARVYERLVNVGTKSKDSAKRQIDIMAEIADDYRELAKKENLFRDDLVPPARTKKDRSHPSPPRDAGLDRAGVAAPEGHQQAGPEKADQG